MATAKKKEKVGIDIDVIDREVIEVDVIGTKPLVLHRLPMHACRELLLPSKRKNQSERESSLKHDPVAEFRSCCHVDDSKDGPTRLVMPSAAFGRAISSAAIDLPGDAKKAQIGRLTFVENDYVPVWGIPKMGILPTRDKGMNRTPIMGTRPFLPIWCARLHVMFTRPMLTRIGVLRLLGAAGIIIGVGDGRTEKGASLNFGQFELRVNDNSPIGKRHKKAWTEITKMGRAAQDRALDAADYYDDFTRELVEWFYKEAERRNLKYTRPTRSGGKKVTRVA